MTEFIRRIFLFILPALMGLSFIMIVQQFLLSSQPIVHHAYICGTILVICAYYVHKYTEHIVIKLSVMFAITGMVIGFAEFIHLLFMR
jgi:hypothetical protein